MREISECHKTDVASGLWATGRSLPKDACLNTGPLHVEELLNHSLSPEPRGIPLAERHKASEAFLDFAEDLIVGSQMFVKILSTMAASIQEKAEAPASLLQNREAQPEDWPAVPAEEEA